MGAVRVLVLGGTGFIGRTIVELLLVGGHRPALFNRGSDRSIFPDVERLIGDRETGDLAALRGGTWDAVVDLTGYYPHQIDATIDALGDRVGRYVLISSHAVFDGAGPALRPPIWDADGPLTNDTYGPSKVAAEQRLTGRYGDRATIVRPCKVAGPHDNQDGLTYWVRRAARGGLVALPGDPAQPIQLVDVRDVAALVVRLIAEGRGGAFTAAGPRTDLAGLIATCAAAAGTTVEVVPVPPVPGFFPLVRPREVWNTLDRVPAPEMTVTPLSVTAGDVLAWDRARGEPPLDRGFTDAEQDEALREGSKPGEKIGTMDR
jgi:2'-hydroxyisoflavone reductase